MNIEELLDYMSGQLSDIHNSLENIFWDIRNNIIDTYEEEERHGSCSEDSFNSSLPDRVDVEQIEQDNVVSSTVLLVDEQEDGLFLTIADRNEKPFILAFGKDDINEYIRILNRYKEISNV